MITFEVRDIYYLKDRGVVFTGYCPIAVSSKELYSVIKQNPVLIFGVPFDILDVEQNAVDRINVHGWPIGLLVKTVVFFLAFFGLGKF